MGASENRVKSQKMAADLKARGYHHGRRQSSPYPNSGGMTMSEGPGSSNAQRRKPGGDQGYHEREGKRRKAA
jgi:hypothetical protein